MRVVKWVAILLLAFQLVVSPAAAMTGNKGEPAHYVALGDSLAAGIIETGEIGQGYADYLAQMLEEENLLATYNKGFAYLFAAAFLLISMLSWLYDRRCIKRVEIRCGQTFL